MSNTNIYTPLQPIINLTSVFQQTEVHRNNLKVFADHLRKNQSVIKEYQGICKQLKNFFETFDSSQPYKFDSYIAGINNLPELSTKLNQLQENISQCAVFPDQHSKEEIIELSKKLCLKCQNEITLEQVGKACSEVDQALKQLEELKNKFSIDENNRQVLLHDKLAAIYNNLEESENLMWQDKYQELKDKINEYTSKILSESNINSLKQKIHDAINDRKEHIHATETEYSLLQSSKHISDDYMRMKDDIMTKHDYNDHVQELIAIHKEKNAEIVKNIFKVIGKVIGIIFVIIGTIFTTILGFFFHKDDK